MFTYQIAELSKLGEFDETYGQTYWVKVSDDLMPLKFNSKDQHIGVGDNIECEEKAMKKSNKGIEYWQLKKVRVVEAASPPQKSTAPSAESQTQLDRIEAKLDKLLGVDEDLDSQAIDDMPPDFLT
jgi:hypothetical protein